MNKHEDAYNMTNNIVHEYNEFLGKLWEQFSEETKDALKPDQQAEHIYGTMAEALNQFFQKKLETIESDNSTD